MFIYTCLFIFFGFKCLIGFDVPKVVNAILEPYIFENQVPGMSIAITHKGKDYLLSYGTANSETIFALASITKVFTAIELALQVEAKKLKLEDVYTHSITLEQLATHTSSLPRVLPLGATIDTFLQNWTPAYPIGTHYLYSNLGFGLLGKELENSTHQTYEQMVKNDILIPLKMYSTRLNPTSNPLLQASGGLTSTSSDMLKFLKANLGEDVPFSILKAMQLAQKGYFKVNNQLTIGLGWQRVKQEEHLLIDKNGGLPGFSTYIGFYPDKKIGIVILANKAKINSTKLGRSLLKALYE